MPSIFVRAVSALILAAAATRAASVPARGDALYEDGAIRHGKVIQMDSKAVTFAEGCSGTAPATVPWSAIDDLVLDAHCDSGGSAPTAAGGGICGGLVRTRFLIFAKRGGKPIPADQVSLHSDGILNYEDRAANVAGHGPIADVSGISYRQVCTDDASKILEPPASFCSEPVQFAVNFSYESPLANQVLTRGFSFFPVFLPSGAPLSEAERNTTVSLVRTGFGTALTNWFSKLLQRKARYDPALQAFIDSLISKSASGYMMMLPPQVIALKCPQAATFIVQIYRDHAGPFSANAELKVAYAAKPGRTLVLNFADYGCWKQGYAQYALEKQTNCVNIDAILTHELGHAFGLGHSKEDDSIMTPIIRVAEPSADDADLLAAKLLESIRGGAPGAIAFTTDDGVAVDAKP